MGLNKNDLEKMIDLYETRFKEHGYDPKSLGWMKGKQNMRFSVLSSIGKLDYKSILDIGCGFGDLCQFLGQKFEGIQYCGIDCTASFITEANKRYAADNVRFVLDDFLSADVRECDFALGSGIFNYQLSDQDNYEYIFDVITKAFEMSAEGVAFDFLSDKVDYKKYEVTFHSDPAKIIDFCYSLSRNVVLRNDYAPFEFAVFIAKDDSFDASDTIFSRYKNNNSDAH